MTAGATRFRHQLRQLALLCILGHPAQHAVAVAGARRRPIDATLDELSRRRRHAQIAARRALQL